MLSLKRIHPLENAKYLLEGYKNNKYSEKRAWDQFFQKRKSKAVQLRSMIFQGNLKSCDYAKSLAYVRV